MIYKTVWMPRRTHIHFASSTCITIIYFVTVSNKFNLHTFSWKVLFSKLRFLSKLRFSVHLLKSFVDTLYFISEKCIW